MDFKSSELETAICDVLSKFLRDKYDFASRTHKIRAAEWTDDVWRELAALGVLSVAINEEEGGLGGDFAELAAVMRTLGQWIVNEPFLTSIVMCAGILQECPSPFAKETLKRIGAGDLRCSLAYAETANALETDPDGSEAVCDGHECILNGKKLFILDGPHADCFIVSARLTKKSDGSMLNALLLVDATARGVHQTSYRTIDDRYMSDIVFRDVILSANAVLALGNEADGTLQRALDDATLAVCAEACGVMEAMLEQTVEYTRHRRQFGRAIAENQVIEHRLVDMMIAMKQSNSMTNVASRMVETPDRSAIVAAAKSFVSKSCRFVAQSAVQLHGGIGISNDLAISHYFRRALLIEQQFGSAEDLLCQYLGLSQKAA